MLAEIIVLFGSAVTTVGTIAFNKVRSDSKEWGYAHIPTPPSPSVELILELLASDEGWSYSLDSSTIMTHETGVLLSKGSRLSLVKDTYKSVETIRAKIQDDSGQYQPIDISTTDEGRLLTEFASYQRRAAHRRENDITRALAKRVLARESSVLGGSGSASIDSSEPDSSVRSPPARLQLSYGSPESFNQNLHGYTSFQNMIRACKTDPYLRQYVVQKYGSKVFHDN